MADVKKLLPFKAVHSYIAINVDDPHDICHPIEDKIQNEKKDSIFMSKRNILIIQFCLGWFQTLKLSITIFRGPTVRNPPSDVWTMKGLFAILIIVLMFLDVYAAFKDPTLWFTTSRPPNFRGPFYLVWPLWSNKLIVSFTNSSHFKKCSK